MANILPTCKHFARCWNALHKKSSRRTMEVALAWFMISQIIRFLQSLDIIPSIPFLASLHQQSPIVAALITAGDKFYATLWPNPAWFITILLVGSICTFAGLHQVFAALKLAQVGGNPMHLAEKGEDDERFLSSVDPSWLLWDVWLRRIGMWCGIYFFGTLSWELFIHAGFASVLTTIILCLCFWVDDRLDETNKQLDALVKEREKLKQNAFLALVSPPRLTLPR